MAQETIGFRGGTGFANAKMMNASCAMLSEAAVSAGRPASALSGSESSLRLRLSGAYFPARILARWAWYCSGLI
jgi:hypothetical protein